MGKNLGGRRGEKGKRRESFHSTHGLVIEQLLSNGQLMVVACTKGEKGKNQKKKGGKGGKDHQR